MSRTIFAIIFAAALMDTHAQSSLPPCETATPSFWTDCFGNYTDPSGDNYVGEFKNNMYHGAGNYTFAKGHKFVGMFREGVLFGQGSLISNSGYTIVEGNWADRVVSVGETHWLYTGGNDDGSSYYFVALSSIRLEGALRRAWVIVGHSRPNLKTKSLSFRTLNKFDCIDDRYLTLTETQFSGAFATGNVLASFDGESFKWEYAAPNTVFSFVLRAVCEYDLNTRK